MPASMPAPVVRRRLFPFWAFLLALFVSPLSPYSPLEPAQTWAQDLKAEYPATGEPSFVKLIDAGAEPRTALRYTIANGYKAQMDMTMTMAMTMNMDGMALPKIQMPPMKMSADISVTGVDPAGGDITYNAAFTGLSVESAPGVDPGLVTALKSLDADIKAIQGTATVSNRGINRSVAFDLSKVTNPQLRQMMGSLSSSMENLSMPLPEESVGVGARWEVRQSIQVNGIQTYQKVDVELTGFDGKTANLKVSLSQTAPAQDIKSPDLPPGAEAHLHSLSSSGSGTIALPLGSLVPSSTVDMQSKTSMEVKFGGQTQKMNIDMGIKVDIAPGK